MFAEFDTESMVGAGVQALHEPFDNELSAHIKPLDLIDHRRLEILFDRHKRLIG